MHLENMEVVKVNKHAIVDLIRLREEFDSIVDSLELMGDPQFMESYKKSQEQIKKGDFANWDDL